MSNIKIEKNFSRYVIFAEDSIITALEKISSNKSRHVFVISESGILQGVLSDGDFRRWIVNCDRVDLSIPVTSAMNTIIFLFRGYRLLKFLLY